MITFHLHIKLEKKWVINDIIDLESICNWIGFQCRQKGVGRAGCGEIHDNGKTAFAIAPTHVIGPWSTDAVRGGNCRCKASKEGIDLAGGRAGMDIRRHSQPTKVTYFISSAILGTDIDY
ncbi:hypothetical protein ACLOJK_031881, partial [Asimina triloba]